MKEFKVSLILDNELHKEFPFTFNLNGERIYFTVKGYLDTLSVNYGGVAMVSGFVKGGAFVLQSSERDVSFFRDDLVKQALKAYKKETGIGLKYR